MRRFPVLIPLAALAAACASAPRRAPAGALAVPIVRQETEYSCGPASLSAVMQYWGAWDGGERELYGPLGTTEKDGTEPGKLAEVARDHGLDARVREDLTLDDLESAVRAGETAIVDYQAWRTEPATMTWRQTWEDGHYSVVIGLDGDNVYFMDPSAGLGYGWIPRAEFLERWHDYEDPAGRPRRFYQHMAVLVKGKESAGAYPEPPVRVR